MNKFDAPKATLMSYIIKGILNQQLPWALVLLGVMIAVVLEMCGIPSLAFAVGVYLPLSSSMPIFIGGAVRWLVDRHLRGRLAHRRTCSEAELIAETDRSPGVLMASGYIAGGAIAGIGIAFMAGALTGFNQRVTDFMTAHNPFFAGPWSDLPGPDSVRAPGGRPLSVPVGVRPDGGAASRGGERRRPSPQMIDAAAGWWCSPARASRPSPASPTSAAPAASGAG